jgi:hypothetical protein
VRALPLAVGVLGAALAASTAHADLTCGGDLPPGSGPLRRLTFTEFDNTVFDLLGDDSRPAKAFPEEGGSGFDNNAHLQVATRLHAEKYLAAAETLAARAVSDLDRLLGCSAFRPAQAKPRRVSAAELGCVRDWISRFGLRAWRRPLTGPEHGALLGQFRRARAEGDTASAIRRVLTTLLQSPMFLYRVEAGEPVPGVTNIRKLTGYEVATRLAYFLWGTMPDEALLGAARAGELSTRAQVAGQARRMIADVRARATVRRFYEQWLDLRLLPDLGKEESAYPSFTREIPKLLLEELLRFVDYATWESDGRLETVLLSPVTFVNGRLARFYGLQEQGQGQGQQGIESLQDAPDNKQWVRVVDTHRRRAGILTSGAFMAMHAKRQESHPIKRGLMLREQLLCQIPPPPPDDVNLQLPKASKALPTLRDRLEDHRLDVGCAKCHKLFDPLGLAFEHYDGAGRWRAEDNGQPIDASGALVSSDVDGEFKDAVELLERLATSRQVRDCYVRQWFRFAYGRTESKQDACTLNELGAAFEAAQHDIRELLVALTQTDAFRYRRAGDAPAQARAPTAVTNTGRTPKENRP